MRAYLNFVDAVYIFIILWLPCKDGKEKLLQRQYARRLKQQETGRRRKKCNSEVVTCTDDSTLEGCRIVELKTLATKLICICYKEILSLTNVEKERRNGLVSILSVRCHKCLLVNDVPTGKRHENPTGQRDIYTINSKAVIGKHLV